MLPAGRNQFYWQKNSAAAENNSNKTESGIGTRDELIGEITNLKQGYNTIVSEYEINQDLENILSTLTSKKLKLFTASDNVSKLVAEAAIILLKNKNNTKKTFNPFYIREAIVKQKK